jgi:putative ABC transport system substrate-binding protein
VTGLTGEVGGVEMATKRLQLLREAVPSASRVAVLGYGLQTLETSSRSSVESAGRYLGQTVLWAHARTAQDVKTAFAKIEKERADSLYVEAQAVNYRHVREIAKASDLPVQQPTRFDPVINTETAKVLGITVPHSLLIRAELI